MVLERDPLRVAGRHAQLGVAALGQLELALCERPHGVDPRLFRRVHETRVNPRGHPVDLETNRRRRNERGKF